MPKKDYYTLSELLEMVENGIKVQFGDVHFKVLAETSDVKIYEQKGWCFLKLIEKRNNQNQAKTDAIIWDRQTILNFEKITEKKFTNEMECLFSVSVEFRKNYGFSLFIHDIDAGYTIGKARLDKQKVMDELARNLPYHVKWIGEELVSYNHSLSFPKYIKKVAVISGKDSDGLNDFLNELAGNKYGVKLEAYVYECLVQGKNAPEAISKVFQDIQKDSFDVVVICRGGGAQTDLEAFDSYLVAASVATSNIPVVCGIGHTKNYSIADMLAFKSVKTPTKAASIIIEHNLNVLLGLRDFETKIKNAANIFVQLIKAELGKKESRLEQSVFNYLAVRKNQLSQAENSLRLFHPENVLNRGFAIVYQDKKVIEKSSLLKQQEFEIKFMDKSVKIIPKNG